jgi:hypothetical protein
MDCVVMFPPIRDDCRHFQHKFRFLKLGGHLIAVVNLSVTFGENPQRIEMMELIASCGRIVRELPAGTFEGEVGHVRTVIVELTSGQAAWPALP